MYYYINNDLVYETVDINEAEKYGRRVAKTKVGKYEVSTVVLMSSPKTFETMVFEPPSYEDLAVEQYISYDDAVKGHKEMVKRWRNNVRSDKK